MLSAALREGCIISAEKEHTQLKLKLPPAIEYQSWANKKVINQKQIKHPLHRQDFSATAANSFHFVSAFVAVIFSQLMASSMPMSADHQMSLTIKLFNILHIILIWVISQYFISIHRKHNPEYTEGIWRHLSLDHKTSLSSNCEHVQLNQQKTMSTCWKKDWKTHVEWRHSAVSQA